IMIGCPIQLRRDALIDKSKPFGDRPAAGVMNGTANLDARECQPVKGIRDHRAAGCRHNAITLMGFVQPVADLRYPTRHINIIVADHADQLIAMPDTRIHAAAASVLAQPKPQHPAHIFQRPGAVYPGEPRPQIHTVAFDQIKQYLAVRLSEQTQVKVSVDVELKHAAFYEISPFALATSLSTRTRICRDALLLVASS